MGRSNAAPVHGLAKHVMARVNLAHLLNDRDQLGYCRTQAPGLSVNLQP